MLTQLVHSMIDFPERCTVHSHSRDEGATFVVRVAAADIEKFVGRNARTCHSLQVIVGALGMKYGRRFTVAFEEQAMAPNSGRIDA